MNARDAGYFVDAHDMPNVTITEAVVEARARDLVGRKDITVERLWGDAPAFRFTVGGYSEREHEKPVRERRQRWARRSRLR